jgi:hypothetical protein
MKTVEVSFDSKKIDDFVNNRLSANDAADFEADMVMDVDLQKEVARAILKKMVIERKVREQVELAEKERQKSLFMTNQLYATEKKCQVSGVKMWWQRLSQNFVSY